MSVARNLLIMKTKGWYIADMWWWLSPEVNSPNLSLNDASVIVLNLRLRNGIESHIKMNRMLWRAIAKNVRPSSIVVLKS